MEIFEKQRLFLFPQRIHLKTTNKKSLNSRVKFKRDWLNVNKAVNLTFEVKKFLVFNMSLTGGVFFLAV
jgi:hypothetical protein